MTFRFNTRLGIGVLLGVLTLLAVFVGSKQGQADTEQTPLAAQINSSLLAGKENTYPAVVAKVNERVITGETLSIREAMMLNSGADVDRATAQDAALDQLIREEAMLEVAATRKITVSDEAVMKEIRSIQQDIAQHGDVEAKAGLAAYIASFNVSSEAFATDPRAIAEYRRGDILGLMRESIVDTLPTEDRNNQEAVRSALDKFVAESGVQITVLLNR